MVIADGLFIQGLQTRPWTSLCLLGLKGPPTTQSNSSHSTLAPISSCLFPSTTQTNASLGKVYLPPPETQRENGAGRCPCRSASVRVLHLDRVRVLQGDLVSSGMRGDHQHLRSRVVAPLGGFILFDQAEASFGNGLEL